MVRSQVLLDEEAFCLAVLPTWEQSFNIRFTSADFAQAATVGDIWAVVQKRVVGNDQLAHQASCATQRTFYRLRQALIAFGHTRASITPQSPLTTLFPLQNRRRRWKQLQQESGLSLPSLRVHFAVFLLLWALTTASIRGIGWGMALLAGLGVAISLSDCPLLQVALPTTTLGEVVTKLVYSKYHVFIPPSLIHNRMELRHLVLAGLASCGAEEKELFPDELQDGTVLRW